MNRGGVFSKLNLHLFLLIAVVAVDGFIGVRYALAWRAIRAAESGSFVQEGLKYQQLQSQMQHLNGLFQHKAVSWTATMTDLETVLPSGVQVMSIDPIVAPDGHVTIRLRVTGDRGRALDLIRNLEKSRHFASPRLASETLATGQGPQNVNTGDVNFDILADYRPLPLQMEDQDTAAKDAVEKTKGDEDGGATP